MRDLPRYNCLVVGAGPAGLFAAIRVAERLQATRKASERDILVLERCPKPARKLLITGSGQCNITQAGEIADFLGHYGGGAKPESAARFLRPSLFGFSNEALLAWFREKGIEFETEEGGKVFPGSRRASCLLDTLLAEAGRRGIAIKTDRRVIGIERHDDVFIVRAEANAEASDEASVDASLGTASVGEFQASSLLLATGGASYPATGSSGDGYALAASLGHRIVAPRPALAPVFIKNFALGGLAGLSFRGAGLTIRRAGEKAIEREGDLLITHQGFSGPLILDASRFVAAGDRVEIRFLDCGIEKFKIRLDEALQANPQRLVRTILAEIGPAKSMAERFCQLAGIGSDDKAADLSRPKREALCRLACAQPFEVEKTGSFSVAMVTAGGVDISEVNAKTMESRIVPGLYFAGELLDLDGDTGGYNLQAAFSTGDLAASAIAARSIRRRSPRG